MFYPALSVCYQLCVLIGPSLKFYHTCRKTSNKRPRRLLEHRPYAPAFIACYNSGYTVFSIEMFILLQSINQSIIYLFVLNSTIIH